MTLSVELLVDFIGARRRAHQHFTRETTPVRGALYPDVREANSRVGARAAKPYLLSARGAEAWEYLVGLRDHLQLSGGSSGGGR